jgi:hypothetical protein
MLKKVERLQMRQEKNEKETGKDVVNRGNFLESGRE